MMNDLSTRQTEIVSLARVTGRVGVEELARRYEVSAQTIRKDLNELCDRHLLSRVHGGAIVSSGVENIAYEARRFVAAAEKRAIGLAAAALIPNSSSLFINIGTTTEEVAKSARGPRRPPRHHQQHKRGDASLSAPAHRSDRRRRHGATLRRRRRRRLGERTHPPVQGGPCRHRRLGDRSRRNAPRFRLSRGPGGSGHPARIPATPSWSPTVRSSSGRRRSASPTSVRCRPGSPTMSAILAVRDVCENGGRHHRGAAARRR